MDYDACACGVEDISGALGNPWLDRLPGVVGGAIFRRYIENRFRKVLHGEVMTFDEDHKLRVHLLRPQSDVPEATGAESSSQMQSLRGCVVFLHGGGCIGGAPSQFYPYAHQVANRMGLVSACCEYRTQLTHPRARMPFDAIEDAERCVKYVHDNAEQLGVDRSRLVLSGASSGGYLAAMAALDGLDQSLAGLVLFNPVVDLNFSEKFQYRPLGLKLSSWYLRSMYGTDRVQEQSPLNRVRNLSFPTLILHGAEDNIVPLSEVEAFERSMRSSGNHCTVVPFAGEDHFFFNWVVSPRSFSRCIGLLGSFLSSIGVVNE